MIVSYLKHLFRNGSFLTLFKNFSFLSIIQILGIIYPLITYPYLIRVLGGELYGMVVFAQAIMAYVVIVVNFGFNVSAVRRVSENRNNIDKICEIYSSVTLLKLTILVISLIVLSISCFCFDSKISIIILLLMGLAIEEVFFPIWLFQGLEEMKYITFITFIAKTVYVVLVVTMISSPDHYLRLPLLISVSSIMTSLCALQILKKKGIRFVRVKMSQLHNDFVESLPFFTSRLASVVMERSNVLIIGVFFDYTMVSIYDLCIKVVSIIRTPFGLVSQVIYPHVVRNRNMNIVKKTYYTVIIAGCVISIIVMFCSNLIVQLLSGDNLLGAETYLMIMIWYVPIVGASYILGASTLVVNGLSKEYNLSVVYSLIFYVLMITIFYFFKIINLSTITIAMLLPELFTLLYRRYITQKQQLF